MYNDTLITLYMDLCKRKVKKDIRSIIDDMRVVVYRDQPINTAIQSLNASKYAVLQGITPNIYSVFTKISDYKEEIYKNTDMFCKNRRSFLIYIIAKTLIRIRYFFWIIWWYIKN